MKDQASRLTCLDDTIDGDVLRPGQGACDAARSVWNGMVDRRPAAIMQCASTDDAVAAIRFARELDLEIGVSAAVIPSSVTPCLTVG